MAINKNIIQNKPVNLCNIPEPNPDYSSAPIPMHCEQCPKPTVYNSFDEALAACELFFLKPGKTHTEYYKDGNEIHCVIAIGNIYQNRKHLYLSDTGNKSAIEQFEELFNTNEIQDVSINLLFQYINAEPIPDASIESLFHNDIYTINLCCYTKGGYIQIKDVYDETRVAECTPHNEYKTYVAGDEAILTAIPNRGYKLNYWLLDANYDEPIYNASVNYIFNEDRGDINVIGTLNDGMEQAPIKNGYTAIFSKLMELKFDTSVLNSDIADSFDDKLDISGDIYEIFDGVAYIGKGENAIITAEPANKHHFKYFVVDSSIVSETNPYTIENFTENHTIIGYFEEERYKFFAEPNIAEYGNIEVTYTLDGKPYAPKANTVITGVNAKLNASPKEKYKFNCWRYGVEEEHAGEIYSLDQQINVLIDENSVKYLVAEFERIPDPEVNIFELNVPNVDEGIVTDNEYNLNNGSIVGNDNFGGIKFGSSTPSDFNKNYIEAIPTETITAGCILEIKAWIKSGGSDPLTKKLKFKSINWTFKDDMTFEHHRNTDDVTEEEIATYTYVFEEDIEGSLFVGVDVDSIRLHSIKITKINE